MSVVTFSGDLTETVTFQTVEDHIVVHELCCYDCKATVTVDTIEKANRWAEDHTCPKCAVCGDVLTGDGTFCGSRGCAWTSARLGLGDE